MRLINLYFDSRDAKLYKEVLARQGEHLASTLVMEMPDEIKGYKYIAIFELSDGTPVYTQELIPVGSTITYDLDKGLTSQTGDLKVELQAYEDVDAENKRVIKSAITRIKIYNALLPVSEVMPEDYMPWYTNAVQQATIAGDEAKLASTYADNARLSAEGIVTQENARAVAETTRVSNESERIANEIIRVAEEADRQDAESARVILESNRVTAEANRVNAEALRVTAEANRKDGKDGKDGINGTNGADGKDGYTPIKGVDYFDGKDGINGTNGVDGHTPIKGVDYFDGAKGEQGEKGEKGDPGTAPEVTAHMENQGIHVPVGTPLVKTKNQMEFNPAFSDTEFQLTTFNGLQVFESQTIENDHAIAVRFRLNIGTYTFSCATDCEPNNDYLAIEFNPPEKIFTLSGQNFETFTEKVVEITEDDTTVFVSYHKDYGDSVGRDRCWFRVDDGKAIVPTKMLLDVEDKPKIDASYTHLNSPMLHKQSNYSEQTGYLSNAEGIDAHATGKYSHSQNAGTISQGIAQTVIGQYNVPQGSNESFLPEDHAFIIGSGTDPDNRSNAFSVDWVGNVDIPSGADLRVGGIGINSIKTATLTTAWVGSSAPYTQTVIVGGIKSTQKPLIGDIPTGTNTEKIAQKQAWNMVSEFDTADGSITFTCFEEKPTVAINIQIKGV